MHTDPSLDTECTPLKLADYELLSELAQRGVVNVYLARRSGPLSSGELVVVKRARPELVLEAQVAEAFVSASRAALCLEHPNIVRTQAVAAEGSDYHVVEEFVDGRSLHRLWRSDTAPPLPRDLYVWILTQVLSGLHYAHERVQCDIELPRGFAHQLVNPSSVLVSYGGEVKLADFGLGALFGAILAVPAERATRQLAYAAPEQCLGAPVDHRADVFAVGIMLWEALTGCQRWDGHSDAEMFLDRVQGEEPPIAPLAPTAPPALVAICERALAYDPNKRFQSALEFSQALDGYLQTTGWVGGAQQLSVLTRGQIEGTSDYPARGSLCDVGLERLSHASSAELRASVPTGLTHTVPAPVCDTEPTFRRVMALMTIVPTLAARCRRLPVLAAAVTMAGFTVALAFFWQSEASSLVSVNAPLVPASHLPNPKALDNTAFSPSTQAVRLTLSVNVSPPQALLRLDGSPISNPYFELHAVDHETHHLSASLAGYEPFEKEVPFDANVDWSIVLNPAQNRGGAEHLNGVPE